MGECEVCHGIFSLEDLQWVAGPLGDNPDWKVLLNETLMCNACLKNHLDKVWSDPGQVQVQD